jgi:hypothetical protein
MAETLGSICDKLISVKLKIFHSQDQQRLNSLAQQEHQLIAEIDEYLSGAFSGAIPLDKLTFAANKVYKAAGNEIEPSEGSIGEIFAELCKVDCLLWHEQEKVYDFENVPQNQKNEVIKNLAVLNLQRNECIDGINRELESLVRKTSEASTANN